MNEIKIKGLDETVYEASLDNGLRVYMWIKESLSTFYATYSVKYGSLHVDYKVGSKEYHTPFGVAHFLEHIKFNLNPNETAHDVFYRLGSDTNAFTTFKYTNYQVLGNKDPYLNVNQLLDFVQTPYFTKQMVSKEKGIIIEEAGMGLDNPYMSSMYGLLKNLFKAPECNRVITGNKEDIKEITLEDIENVYKYYYHPENSFVVVTGNFNPYEMLATIKENQSKKEFGKYSNPVRIKKNEPKKVLKNYEELIANVSSYKMKVGIKIPISNFGNIDEYELSSYIRMIAKINFGSTSDFKNDLIDKELVNNLYYSLINFENFFCLIVTVDTDYKEEVLERLYEKLDNITISEKEFNRIKNANLATTILNYEDVETVNSLIQEDIVLYDKILDNKKEILENLTYDKADEVLKNIDFNNRSTHVLKPNN